MNTPETSAVKKISIADDHRHTPDSSSPEWSESWVFYAIDPTQGFCCITRLGLAPNKQSCSVLVAISQRGKPLYHRHQEHLSLPAGDLHEGISAGGLSLRAIDLETRHYRMTVAGVAGLSNMHIEQMGRIAGRFDYRAQHIELAGMGPRDHSVGTRNWESMLWYDLAWVLLDDGRALGLIQAQQTGRLVQIPWLWDGTQLHVGRNYASWRIRRGPAATGARHLL